MKSDKDTKRFISKAKKDSLVAVQVLTDLDEGAGLGKKAGRVYACAVADKKLQDFQKRYGLKKHRGHACLRRLVGKRCNVEGNEYDGVPCQPPGADHCTLWTFEGRPAVFILQPYWLEWKTLCELVDLCRWLGLTMRINPIHDWYFPGRAICIEIWRPEIKPEIFNDR